MIESVPGASKRVMSPTPSFRTVLLYWKLKRVSWLLNFFENLRATEAFTSRKYTMGPKAKGFEV